MDPKIPKNKYPLSGVIEYNYTNHPKATFVLDYFRHQCTMKDIISRIRKCGEDVEIIVNNDSRTELGEWTKLLNHRNDLMLVSNDLSELRVYNNCIHLSHSDYIIISQDDDVPPDNPEWFYELYNLFESDPTLGLVSIYKGSVQPWTHEAKRVKANAKTGLIYMHWVATGPMMIRKSAFLKVGGATLDWGDVGEACGGWDNGFCVDLWENGYKVALYGSTETMKWKRHVGGKGQAINPKKTKLRDARILFNFKYYLKKYSKERLENIEQLVIEANKNQKIK